MVIHNFTSKQASEMWNNFERTWIIIIILLSLKLLCEIVHTGHAFILFKQLPKKYKIHTVTCSHAKRKKNLSTLLSPTRLYKTLSLWFNISTNFIAFPFQMELSSYWILVVLRLLLV